MAVDRDKTIEHSGVSWAWFGVRFCSRAQPTKSQCIASYGDVNFQRAQKNSIANQTKNNGKNSEKKHLLLQCICCSFVAFALCNCPVKCGPIFNLANQNKFYSISKTVLVLAEKEKAKLDFQPRWTILIRCNSHSAHLIRHSPRWFWWICWALFHLSEPQFFFPFRFSRPKIDNYMIFIGNFNRNKTKTKQNYSIFEPNWIAKLNEMDPFNETTIWKKKKNKRKQKQIRKIIDSIYRFTHVNYDNERIDFLLHSLKVELDNGIKQINVSCIQFCLLFLFLRLCLFLCF